MHGLHQREQEEGDGEGKGINERCFRKIKTGRKRRVKRRRRMSHIPSLMHGAIDSGLLPAYCPHFKESMGTQERVEGREEEYTRMSKEREGGLGSTAGRR